MDRIITLTTDFGLDDGYVASMKGAILSINPQVTIVDVTHQVPPQDILYGAYVLSTAYPYFPPGSIHVAVVDPGVGSARRAVAVAVGGRYCVGPDNGVLSLALGGIDGGQKQNNLFETAECPLPPGSVAVELTDPRFHLPEVSATFHGRDIFAPAAAHLSSGVAIESLGPRVETLRRLLVASPAIGEGGAVEGAIVHIDGFGNATTNIRREHMTTDKVEVRAGSVTLHGLSPSYAAGDGAVALWGSTGCLEVAVSNGNAAAALGLKRGDPIKVKSLR